MDWREEEVVVGGGEASGAGAAVVVSAEGGGVVGSSVAAGGACAMSASGSAMLDAVMMIAGTADGRKQAGDEATIYHSSVWCSHRVCFIAGCSLFRLCSSQPNETLRQRISSAVSEEGQAPQRDR